jgi:CubicO group peptidase (beta-lactamase class C family)
MALVLQGLLIQTVSETNYVDYMRANVFDPLGMASAKFMHEFNGNYEPICFPAYAKANSFEPYGISGIASGDLALSLEDMVKFL